MSIDYDELNRNLNEAFDEYGTTMYFYHKIDGERNSVTGITEFSNLVTRVKGLATNFSEIVIDGDLIQKGDKQLMISKDSGRPSLGDRIKIDDTFYTVVNVREIRPANTTIIYELHIRSYAVGEDIDRLFVDLGALQEGSLLVDPNKSGTPVWRVVAHNHHRVGYSTLITDKIWEMVSFNGTTEIGAAYPVEPWNGTFMRRWLQNEFSKSLSAKMIANLNGVVIKTYQEGITDTISLLSKMELTGVSTTGQNNGKHIPYFEADSSRIAYYDDPKRKTDQATEYWTRDGWGVGADGKIKTFNPSYIHGVRPVIFLPISIKTALNFNGEYELQFE